MTIKITITTIKIIIIITIKFCRGSMGEGLKRQKNSTSHHSRPPSNLDLLLDPRINVYAKITANRVPATAIPNVAAPPMCDAAPAGLSAAGAWGAGEGTSIPVGEGGEAMGGTTGPPVGDPEGVGLELGAGVGAVVAGAGAGAAGAGDGAPGAGEGDAGAGEGDGALFGVGVGDGGRATGEGAGVAGGGVRGCEEPGAGAGA